MDFFQIKEVSRPKDAGKVGRPKAGEETEQIVVISPDFIVCQSKDLMIRGGKFYAVWDSKRGMWSTNEYDVGRLVDEELFEHCEKLRAKGVTATVKSMSMFSSRSWVEFRNYIRHISDSYVQLDEQLTFSNTVVKKKDYVSKRLSYSLEEGPCESYDELMGTLYDPDERQKLEWAIGSIVSGDSKSIQKFIVLYGEPGAGKGTIINIIQKLFDGYYTTFEAKALVGSNNDFATEMFRDNSLVAIQHDGDLSKIEDNSKLNSIISHEAMTINEKFKSKYTSKVSSFLFMATNKPVKITDSKSGIIRRLIDVRPSGRKVPSRSYHALMAQIDFELGAIAWHCLQVYQDMGKNYYSSYRPLGMMFQTDPFFNFVEANYEVFKEEDGVSLSRAYDIYKQYCEEALVDFKLPRHKFREELKSYFSSFEDVARVDGRQIRSYYKGFLTKMFILAPEELETAMSALAMDSIDSIFDKECRGCKAQYASEQDIPAKKWIDVTTTLSDLDTRKVHYVQLPSNHIVIDFDLKDSEGNKSAKLNAEAASKWPPTYGEYSKSGAGIHLHYYYDGDVSRLSRVYSEGIEIKVSVGGSALRRRLSKCNHVPIATIKSGLPLREEKMIDFTAVKSEKVLRDRIERNLNKEFHAGTKPSMDFIYKILDDAYNSGLKYDVSDMRQKIFIFASNSTHQSEYCVKLISQLKLKSDEPSVPPQDHVSDELVFFDVEVFPNLFIVVWKAAGADSKCVRMINPTSADIEQLMRFKLVGFNCRKYDNHILYARYMGWDNYKLYLLSQRIVSKQSNAMFGEAYNISYTDVYDFASAANKKSLKKFEIELGIHHMELGLPWDKPVPDDLWTKVAEYCDNDVIATEAVFNHLSGDWAARKILAKLSGLSFNDTTNAHSTKIIFGDNKKPQSEFNYRNLALPVTTYNDSAMEFLTRHNILPIPFTRKEGTSLLPFFPGYTYSYGKSIYMGEEVGEGGYVYAEPGIHRDVALLDVASEHPHSAIAEVLFGPRFTERFYDIVEGRIGIKHKDWEKINVILDGKLAEYVLMIQSGEITSKDLANALKTAINSVYGLTAAGFDNPFRDPRNVDNIVAKRGALFMIDVKYAVQERGFTVAHIKTDSIKIPNATPEIIRFVMEFGQKYGYEFEHEATYDRICLVNDAVYIAKYATVEKCNHLYEYTPKECQDHGGEWTATGAQFAHPYVFKTLFSHEKINFEDMCETKSVASAMYLDMNEALPDVTRYEKAYEKLAKERKNSLKRASESVGEDKQLALDNALLVEDEMTKLIPFIEEGHEYKFVGRAGLFCPIREGFGGGLLVREKDGKYYAVGGTKGYRWLESEAATLLGRENSVDTRYCNALVDAAVEDISAYGDFEMFVSDETPPFDPNTRVLSCGKIGSDCYTCPDFVGGIDKPCRFGYDVHPF